MSNQIVDVFEFKDPKTGKIFTAERHRLVRKGTMLKVINDVKSTTAQRFLSDFKFGRGQRSYVWVIPLWVKSLPNEWEEVR